MENPVTRPFFCLMSVAEEQRLEWLGNRLEQQGSKEWNFKRSRKKQAFLNESIQVKNNKIHEDRTGHPTISTGYFQFYLILFFFFVLVIFCIICVKSLISHIWPSWWWTPSLNSSHVSMHRGEQIMSHVDRHCNQVAKWVGWALVTQNVQLFSWSKWWQVTTCLPVMRSEMFCTFYTYLFPPSSIWFHLVPHSFWILAKMLDTFVLVENIWMISKW